PNVTLQGRPAQHTVRRPHTAHLHPLFSPRTPLSYATHSSFSVPSVTIARVVTILNTTSTSQVNHRCTKSNGAPLNNDKTLTTWHIRGLTSNCFGTVSKRKKTTTLSSA
ncbi:unnamed protein product, partial [Lymnaea stagnalis]